MARPTYETANADEIDYLESGLSGTYGGRKFGAHLSVEDYADLLDGLRMVAERDLRGMGSRAAALVEEFEERFPVEGFEDDDMVLVPYNEGEISYLQNAAEANALSDDVYNRVSWTRDLDEQYGVEEAERTATFW